MFKYTNGHKGFTILELLVVIAIIGLLAAIALPKYTGVREDAGIAVSKSNLKALQTALERFYLDSGSYPDDLATLVSGNYVKSNTCQIPGYTENYQYGKDGVLFLLYDQQNDLFATNEGIEVDYSSYSGGITPTAQTL